MEKLQEAVDSDPSNPSHHFNLGLFLWKRSEEIEGFGSRELKDRAVEHFVVSVKLNPCDGASFRFLGHFYSSVSKDENRASRCYQRAVQLNPEDFEAGETLCDLLDASQKESLQTAACREALDKSPKAFWASRRLGYLQVHQKKWSEAVQSLHHALRGYPACADLWEALGIAYQQLGMCTAAIKSYGRAVELEDSRVFALIESGNIQLMLGSYTKGIGQFRHALEITPSNISAHFGLASALLGLSRECVNSGAFSWGTALLEEASNVAESASHLSGNISSVWKLHGDIQIAYAKCLPWEEDMDNMKLDEEIFASSLRNWRTKCLFSVIGAKKSYQRAVHLTPWEANIYNDLAISLDLIFYYRESENVSSADTWSLPEKFSLGSLIMEGVDTEFWITLGCLSQSNALTQHALIRALQLDGPLSSAWAFLGKLYRKVRYMQLAKQAFDHARSMDPKLALPWAGMTVDSGDGKYSLPEAFESCLRAVQIMPLAEFQVGLGLLATKSGQLLSPQVFPAVRLAVKRAPFFPETHNVNGLVCEARKDYHSAIAAYRLSRCAISIFHKSRATSKAYSSDVSVNLARVLCQAGYSFDAIQECEKLAREGLLDNKSLQIYAIALWKFGNYDKALDVAKNLLGDIPLMEKSLATATLPLICKLIYHTSGRSALFLSILEVPREIFHRTKMILIISTLVALQCSDQLQKLLSDLLRSIRSPTLVAEIHSVLAVRKMLNHQEEQIMDTQNGLRYLRKVLHMYPDSDLIRCHLGSLLLSNEDWISSRRTARCNFTPSESHTVGLKLPVEIYGATGVACYANGSGPAKFSFVTCKDHFSCGTTLQRNLQRWLHQEPWKFKARYLLILNILQKAREERFPPYLCSGLRRLLLQALSKETYLSDSGLCHYEKFVMLLCISEVSFQCSDYLGCVNFATDALSLSHPNIDVFFANMQLCRSYAAMHDILKLRKEYMNCLQLKTRNLICWISLKSIEGRYDLNENASVIDVNFGSSGQGRSSTYQMWEALLKAVHAMCSLSKKDIVLAEETFVYCTARYADSCLLLCHGAICLELARQRPGSQLLLARAVESLTKSQKAAPIPLPIVSVLLAQAQASLGAKTEWKRNLQLEWSSWPSERRPAELYFHMHLLARHSHLVSSEDAGIESSQSPERWILRAIHLNPLSVRYWKVLQKLHE